MEKIVILGAGISGISASYHLNKAKIVNEIYEKDSEYGGLCGNFTIDGFRFDRFVHFTFTKNKYVRNLFEKSSEFFHHKPNANNYYKETWIKHPAQNNLFPLPVDEKIVIIKDFFESKDKNFNTINNYEDWLRIQYGDYFAENFPMIYTEKYWTVPAKNLETKWIGRRMHRSSFEEILKGAFENNKSNFYYTNEMRYPKKGGFKSILNQVAKDITFNLNKEASEIDIVKKTIKFKDGELVKFDKLVSTIPLPELVKIIKEVPEEVKDATNKLLHTSGFLVSLGFNKANIPKDLWFYIYDKDILTARVYSPSLKSKDNVPEGCSSIQAEIYFSKEKPLNLSKNEILELTIAQLKKMEIFKDEDLLVKDIRLEKYANIVFKHDIYDNKRIIHTFLKKNHIYFAGRFGEWDYLWSDQSFLSGKRVAEEIVKNEKRNIN